MIVFGDTREGDQVRVISHVKGVRLTSSHFRKTGMPWEDFRKWRREGYGAKRKGSEF